MKKLKELSVSTKLSYPIFILFIVFIVFIGLLIQLNSIDKKEKVKLDLIAQNSILIYKIAYYSNIIASGETQFYNNLNESLLSLNSNINLIKKGGKYRTANRFIVIDTPIDNEKKLISNVEKLWTNYYKNAHLLLETNDRVIIKIASTQTEEIRPLFLSANNELLKFHQKYDASISMILALYSACAIFVFFVMISLTLYYFRYYIYKPIVAISKNANEFLNGKKPNELSVKSNDEVGFITHMFNKVVFSIEQATIFATEISKGNTGYNFEFNKNDKLGVALIKMQESLKQAEELNIEIKQKQDREIWNNKGKVFFSNLVMNKIDDLSDFAYEYISNLVKHTGNIIGAFYLLNENKLEQNACFAYQRRKFTNAKFNYNDGILAEVIKEKKKKLFTEIPKNYIKITSGLGETKPSFLIIIPIVYKGNTLGIIEMAGFKKMPEYKINFVEEIIKDLAFVISDLQKENNTEIESIINEQSEIIIEQTNIIKENSIEIAKLKEELNEKEKYISEINIPFKKLSSIVNN